MTPEEEANLAVVEKWVEYWNNDLDRFVDLYAPDLEVEESSGHVIRGRDALRAFEDRVLKAAPRRRMTVSRTLAQGDTVVVECDLFDISERPELARGRACVLLQIRDGKILRDHSYSSISYGPDPNGDVT